MRRRAMIRRRRLAAGAALARAHDLVPGRAQRFAARCANASHPFPPPRLAELIEWPAWPLREEPVRRRIFAVAALLASHDSLAELISGAELRAYSAAIGEDLLGLVLDCPQAGDAPLPPPDRIDAAGEEIAARGLPPRLAGLFLPRAPADDDDRAEAFAHIAAAEGLLRAAGQL